MSSSYEDLKRWGDWGEAAGLYQEHGCTSHEQAWDWLAKSDRHEWLVWIALRAAPYEAVVRFLQDTVACIEHTVGTTGTDTAWNHWADTWLSGEDLAGVFRWTAEATCVMAGMAGVELRSVCAAAVWQAEAAQAMGDARAAERKRQADFWRKEPNPFKVPAVAGERAKDWSKNE
jgi:hypothetical protein